MNNKTNTISVVIPAYNSEQFLKKCIDSVLAQTLLPEEIIVVDDGSTDGTAQFMQDMVKKHTFIQYLFQENAGPATARNTGIKNAQGEWIAFLDADDTWVSDKLEKQINVVLSDAKIRLVCSGRYRIEEDGQRIKNCVGDSLSENVYQDLWTIGNFIVTSSVVVHRKCFEVVGMFNEDVKILGSEDYEMWFRIVNKFEMQYLNEPLVNYYVSMSGFNRSNFQRAYDAQRYVLETNIENLRMKTFNSDNILKNRWFEFYYQYALTLMDNKLFQLAYEKLKESLRYKMFSFKLWKQFFKLFFLKMIR